MSESDSPRRSVDLFEQAEIATPRDYDFSLTALPQCHRSPPDLGGSSELKLLPETAEQRSPALLS